MKSLPVGALGAALGTVGVVLGVVTITVTACGSGGDLGTADTQVEPVTGLEPVTGIELVLLPAGSFVMGSPPGEPDREPGEMLHRVEITRPFYLGRHEVTQEQWLRVMDANPSQHGGCGACPVETVSWYDVREFLARLSDRTGRRFRLPTEAEWEYACRAGTTGAFATGSRLSPEQANYDGRYRLPPAPGAPPAFDPDGLYQGRALPVGSFPANPWGLLDLHGNVWEWVEDDACPYPDQTPDAPPVKDPQAVCDETVSGGKKGIRGGSWYFNEGSARCALRYTHRPQDVGPSLGFRVVQEVGAAEMSVPASGSASPRRYHGERP